MGVDRASHDGAADCHCGGVQNGADGDGDDRGGAKRGDGDDSECGSGDARHHKDSGCHDDGGGEVNIGCHDTSAIHASDSAASSTSPRPSRLPRWSHKSVDPLDHGHDHSHSHYHDRNRDRDHDRDHDHDIDCHDRISNVVHHRYHDRTAPDAHSRGEWRREGETLRDGTGDGDNEVFYVESDMRGGRHSDCHGGREGVDNEDHTNDRGDQEHLRDSMDTHDDCRDPDYTHDDRGNSSDDSDEQYEHIYTRVSRTHMGTRESSADDARIGQRDVGIDVSDKSQLEARLAGVERLTRALLNSHVALQEENESLRWRVEELELLAQGQRRPVGAHQHQD